MTKLLPISNSKRLFFDIETSPNLVLTWRIGHKINLGYENIVTERAIICVAWKWGDKSKIYYLTWDNNQNDKSMLQEFVKVMHEADELVTHGGDRFDSPWIRTRCLKHGISMSPDFISIDTLKTAKSKFLFNSNRLDYITKFLNIGKKRPTGYDLWKQIVLNRNQAALNKMVLYCKNDVSLLEQVWDKLNPYVKAKTHRGKVVSNCPECNSSNTKVNKHRVTAAGYKKIILQCQDCGKYHTITASRKGKEI